MALIRTDCIDVLDQHGALVMSLDATDVRKAAQQFADTWNDGLISRMMGAQVGDATMTREELDQLAGRAYSDELTFARRYLRGDVACYPEGTIDERGFDVRHTSLALDVKDAISELSARAWSHGVEHIQQTTKAAKENLAVTDGERYLRGLTEVQKLDAMNQLRSAISSMTDKAAKAEMISRYPELFSGSAISELAQARSHGEE